MFYPSQIRTGQTKSFADLVSEYRASKAGTVKTASADTVVKTARSDAKQEEGQSSGQLDVEPLHQEGESTPKVKHKSGNEDQGVQDKVTSSATGQTKAAESSIVDKDNENKGDADTSGQTKADFPKLTNDPEAGKHRDGDGDQDKKVANSANFGDKKAAPFGKKEEKEGEGEKKEASAKPKFVRVANLDSKSKNWLEEYWSNLYMPEYAKAMVADK